MQSMIEHTPLALKIISSVGKGLLWIGIAIGVEPVLQATITEAENYFFLTPEFEQLLNEIKSVLVVLVPIFVLVKMLYEIKKLRKK